MDMIQTDKLVFEYDKRDEDGNIIGKSRAIDEVEGSLLQFLVITVRESPHLQNI